MGDRSRDYDRARERDRERDRDRDRDDRRRSLDMPQFTGREDSRVGDHEFNFEFPRSAQADSYRPSQDNRDDYQRSRAPPTGPRSSRRGGGGGRGGRGGYDRGGRGSRDGKPFVFTAPVPAHERPILYFDTREKTPELMAGMVAGSGDRFKEDAEEQDEEVNGGEGEDRDTPMEVSDGEGESGEKVLAAEVEGETKPEKKPDVISMIRAFKSKAAAAQRNAVAENDDFIPLSFDGDDKPEPESEPEPEPEQGRKMRRANDGHRIVEHHGRERNGSDSNISPTGGFSHRDHHYQRAEERQPVRDVGPPGATGAAPSAASLPPPPSSTIKFNLSDKAKDVATGEQSKPRPAFTEGKDIPWPPPPPPTDLPPPPPPPPGERPLPQLDIPKKRKFEDFSGRRGGGGPHLDGNIKHQYQIVRGSSIDPAPWVKMGGDHSRCFDVGDWYVYSHIDPLFR